MATDPQSYPLVAYERISDNQVMFQVMSDGTIVLNTGTIIKAGVGSPEGVVEAPVGSLYTNVNGTAPNILYQKQTGVGNTGWVAIGSGGGGGGTPGGNANDIQFNDGAGGFGGDDNLSWNPTNFGLGIGTSSPSTAAKLTIVTAAVDPGSNPIEIHQTTGSAINHYTHLAAGAAAASKYVMLKSRGTQGSPVGLNNSDVLGYIAWDGYNGTAYIEPARIDAQAVENYVAGTNSGTTIRFYATPVGTDSLSEVWRMQNQSGNNGSTLSISTTFGKLFGWANNDNGVMDTGFSRLAGNSVALGNGTAGDFSGSLTLTQLTAQGTGQTGAATSVQPIEVHNTNNGCMALYTHSAGNGPTLNFNSSTGTQGSPAATTANQYINFIGWRGYDGSAYQSGAQLALQANGAWTGSNRSACFQFSAVLPNTTAFTEILRFPDLNGNLELTTSNLAASPTVVLGWRNNAGANFNLDAGFSRLAGGSIALGNGTQGDTSGSLTLSKLLGAGTNLRGSVNSVAGTTVSVSYGSAYASTPIVVVTPTTNCGTFFISASSTTGFTITYQTAGAQSFNWIAIG